MLVGAFRGVADVSSASLAMLFEFAACALELAFELLDAKDV